MKPQGKGPLTNWLTASNLFLYLSLTIPLSQGPSGSLPSVHRPGAKESRNPNPNTHSTPDNNYFSDYLLPTKAAQAIHPSVRQVCRSLQMCIVDRVRSVAPRQGDCCNLMPVLVLRV